MNLRTSISKDENDIMDAYKIGHSQSLNDALVTPDNCFQEFLDNSHCCINSIRMLNELYRALQAEIGCEITSGKVVLIDFYVFRTIAILPSDQLNQESWISLSTDLLSPIMDTHTEPRYKKSLDSSPIDTELLYEICA